MTFIAQELIMFYYIGSTPGDFITYKILSLGKGE